uniref:Uncharacterized protein n=1 Tax=Leersia perrieri TaxID=77586 RepID=A0A0D9VTI2_9ORYZ
MLRYCLRAKAARSLPPSSRPWRRDETPRRSMSIGAQSGGARVASASAFASPAPAISSTKPEWQWGHFTSSMPISGLTISEHMWQKYLHVALGSSSIYPLYY